MVCENQAASPPISSHLNTRGTAGVPFPTLLSRERRRGCPEKKGEKGPALPFLLLAAWEAHASQRGSEEGPSKPKMLFFPFDFHELPRRSQLLAPRASRRTKHQKLGLAVQEGNPLTWGLSHDPDPAAPSWHPRDRGGTEGMADPAPNARLGDLGAAPIAWGSAACLVWLEHRNPSPLPPPYLQALRNKTLLLTFVSYLFLFSFSKAGVK